MNSNLKKTLSILLIIIFIIVFAVIIYFLFFYNFGVTVLENNGVKENETAEIVGQEKETETKTTTTKTTVTTTNKNVSSYVSGDFSKSDLEKLAMSFAERLGSFSNHSEYENISDLKIFMSEDMKAWADEQLQESKLNNKSDIYYGLTTKAITDEVQEYDDKDGVARILVSTQRRESTSTMNNFTVFYQDILIEFVKEDGAWKVDGAFWDSIKN